MDLIAHHRAMARYNRWMNEKLFALAATMTEEERKRDLGAFFRSIHGTLSHLLLSDRVWLGRFTGDQERFGARDLNGQPVVPQSLGHVLYDDFGMLRRERAKTDADIVAYVGGLSAAALAEPLSYRPMTATLTATAGPFEHPLGWALWHVFNHQTHHRGQVTTLFKQLGKDPGVTDLVAMLREEQSVQSAQSAPSAGR